MDDDTILCPDCDKPMECESVDAVYDEHIAVYRCQDRKCGHVGEYNVPSPEGD
jgi:hypothetical protein